MIKRISFATRRPGLDDASFTAAWRRVAELAADAPAELRPGRIALCRCLPELLAQPLYDGVGLEWFSDRAHAERFEAWLDVTVAIELEEALDLSASPVLLADEHVLRGEDWLTRRWRSGGRRLKHMAIARRAEGLSQPEFSARWLSRSGRIGAAGVQAAVVIPDEARGLAYVQNHSLAGRTEDWAYDALNEVYFDDLEGLATRIEWFAAQLSAQGEEDLVRESWFLAAEEELIFEDG